MRLVVLADASLVHTYRWIDYFAKQGDEILLISLEDGMVPPGIEFVRISAPCSLNSIKYLLAAPKIRKLSTRFKSDAIIGHFVPNYGLLSSLTGIHPNIICAWGSDILVSAFKSTFHRTKAKWILSHADLITADAQYVVNKIQIIMQKPTPVLLEPLGIEPEHFPLNTLEKKNLLISVRNFEPVYDIATLIKALAIVKPTYPQLGNILIGKGTEQTRLTTLAQNLHLEKYIEFQTPLNRPELSTLLNNAKLYISTSISDGTSVSLLEAMLCGCWPIVTDIPSNREWITDSINGSLFECGNHNQLAALIMSALQLPLPASFQNFNRELILTKAYYYNNMSNIRNNILKLVKHG
jgi:L-malate glycosyltransferase